MLFLSIRPIHLLVLSITLPPFSQRGVPAPQPMILGVAFSVGEFLFNGSPVRTNVSLLDACILNSLISPLHLAFTNGTRADLSTQSQIQLFRDHFLLKTGAAQVRGISCSYANGLHFTAGAVHDAYRMRIDSGKNVQIDVLSGEVLVSDSEDNMLLRVKPGRSLHFSRDTRYSTNMFRLVGRVEQESSRFFLRTEIFEPPVEIVLSTVSVYAGRIVLLTGTRRADGRTGLSSEVGPAIEVSRITPLTDRIGSDQSGRSAPFRLFNSPTFRGESVVVAGFAVYALPGDRIGDLFHGGYQAQVGPTQF